MASRFDGDLKPLRPEDADGLRRYAEFLERPHPDIGWMRQAFTDGIAKTIRGVADRLDEIHGRKAEHSKGSRCDGFLRFRGMSDCDWKCELPPGHKGAHSSESSSWIQ